MNSIEQNRWETRKRRRVGVIAIVYQQQQQEKWISNIGEQIIVVATRDCEFFAVFLKIFFHVLRRVKLV